MEDAPGLVWRAVAAMFSRFHAGFNSVQSLILSSWQGLHVFSPAHCCRWSQVAQAPMLSRKSSARLKEQGLCASTELGLGLKRPFGAWQRPVWEGLGGNHIFPPPSGCPFSKEGPFLLWHPLWPCSLFLPGNARSGCSMPARSTPALLNSLKSGRRGSER